MGQWGGGPAHEAAGLGLKDKRVRAKRGILGGCALRLRRHLVDGQIQDNGGHSMETTDMSTAPERPPLPDHLSIDERSPHYAADVLGHAIGIRFNDKERHDVEEYCISEGWVKVPAGKTLDRKGKPLLLKLKGRVEAFYR